MDGNKAIKVLMECVNIASCEYPGVASDYLAAFKVAEKAIKQTEGGHK